MRHRWLWLAIIASGAISSAQDSASYFPPAGVRLIDSQTYTSGTPTWTKPFGAVWVCVDAIGGGGGGGGGRGGAAGSVRVGGSGGGGGSRNRECWPASYLGATEAVVVGAAGTAGPGGSSADGTAGNAGGDSSFGSFLFAFGGGGGSAGDATGSDSGGSGGGAMGAGTTGSGIDASGGLPTNFFHSNTGFGGGASTAG